MEGVEPEMHHAAKRNRRWIGRTSYYPSGRIREKVSTRRGVMHGFCERYWEDGSIKEMCQYASGKPCGPYSKYHVNGVMSYYGVYSNEGELQGYCEYDQQGLILAQVGDAVLLQQVPLVSAKNFHIQ
jgi:antitoxin component YwqK of YwqJK toxin-antitoxin module